MKTTSHCSLGSRKRARLALLCLAALLLTGCAREENTIMVYSGNTPAPGSAAVALPPTLEPTAIPYSDEIGYGQQAGANRTDITIGYVARESDAIGPYECTERDLISLNHLMYESVVELDNNGQPVPLLADRWSVEQDDKDYVWTFELRSGIRFHNGATLNAWDVINSYQAITNANSKNNPYCELVQPIRRMEYVSDRTFKVYTRISGYIVLYAMTFPVVQTNTIYTSTPRGTGPFWMIGYEPGVSLRLEANPLWWKRGGTLHSINCLNYANTASAIMALNSGEIDMLSTRSYAASQNRSLSSMISMDYTTSTYEMLVPNLDASSVLSDLNVRRAIMYAINRTKVQSNGYLNMLQSSEVPVIPGTWLYETQSALYYYSPERALQILYDDGWGDMNGDGILDRVRDGLLQELSFTIYTYTEDTVSVRPNAAREIADDLRAIGIRCDVTSGTKEDMRKLLKAKTFDLVLVGVNMNAVPNPASVVRSDGALNLSGYANATMDEYCAALSTAPDAPALKAAFSDVQMLTVNDLPMMGLGYHIGTVISDKSLNGLTGLQEFDVWNGMEMMNVQ